ncbi:class I SAM-dependent methyltransferase [Pedococcus sp. 5OH_020]|uniref:class I SAM-dependent methyltransferase n=1 Tax=Pedococcus sp. 5OH_020 TaxID=2989814 RepID=UPI0022E9E475|nr:class I SAM-dependent methyltransferase [Pedococcus sp. 5OH_020]
MGVRRAVGQRLEGTIGKQRTDRLRRAERTVRRRLSPPPPPKRPSLTDLAKVHKTDKWGLHRYTPHYEERLKHLRDKEFTLLEIGIGGFKKERSGGKSLRMWRDYFPRATIVGLDIIDKSYVASERIEVYTGSQTDPELLQRIADEHPDLKVVVDDGSHVPEHVRTTFAVLFPLLPPGGIYAIEDTQTSYWPDWGGQVDPKARGTSMDLVKDLVDGLNYEEFLLEGYEPTYTDRTVRAVHCWHNLVIIEKGQNAEGSNRDRVHDRPYRV